MDSASREMEEAVTAYLRRATETFDLSKNVEVSLCRLLFTFVWLGQDLKFVLFV